MRAKAVIGVVILIAMLFSSIGIGFSSTNSGNSAKNSTVMRDLNSGLVAYWNFDEGSGNILHDVSGNGNDGTIYGATWVRGVKGYALRFDGENDYVDVPDSSLLDLTGDFTLIVWVNEFSHAQGQPYENHILSKHKPDVNSDGSWRFSIGKNDIPFFISYPPYTDYQSRPHIYANTSLSINAWHFVALTFSKEGKYAAFYIDGKMTAQGRIDFEIENTPRDLFIGAENGEKNYFNGTIDEVRIYNRALSADEIKQLYEQYVSQPNNPGGNGMNYLWYIIAGAVVAAVIAIVLVMMKKKGAKSQPQSYYGYPPQYPPQPPQQGQQPPPQQTQPPPPQSVGMITVTCPYCGFTSQIPTSMRRQWVQCPNCGNQFQVQ